MPVSKVSTIERGILVRTRRVRSGNERRSTIRGDNEILISLLFLFLLLIFGLNFAVNL